MPIYSNFIDTTAHAHRPRPPVLSSALDYMGMGLAYSILVWPWRPKYSKLTLILCAIGLLSHNPVFRVTTVGFTAMIATKAEVWHSLDWQQPLQMRGKLCDIC